MLFLSQSFGLLLYVCFTFVHSLLFALDSLVVFNVLTTLLTQCLSMPLPTCLFLLLSHSLAFRIARNSQIKIKLLCFGFRMMILFVRLMAHFLYWWSFLMSFPSWIALERCQHKIDIFFVILQMFSSVDVITTIVVASFFYHSFILLLQLVPFDCWIPLFLTLYQWNTRGHQRRRRRKTPEKFFKRLFILCWKGM